jgi:hypothetical protein
MFSFKRPKEGRGLARSNKPQYLKDGACNIVIVGFGNGSLPF